MARNKKTNTTKASRSSVTIDRPSTSNNNESFMNRIQTDLKDKNALLNIVLGALIVIVAGILIYNYTTKSQVTDPEEDIQSQSTTSTEDVAKDNLPGQYTVKAGDTLFNIAANYYGDGFKYNEIAKANQIADVNNLTTGQVITIPKLEDQLAQAEASPSVTPSATPAETMASPTPQPESTPEPALGGATNETIWGEKITSDTYTVVEGDWLSKIAGRAYGDVYDYNRIAEANNIANPDLIEPGMVLQIPR